MNSHDKKPRILFYAPILEYPPAGGPQMSVTNAIKALSQVSELYVITTVSKATMSQEAEDFVNKHAKALYFSPSSSFGSDSAFLGRVLRRLKRVEFSPVLAVNDVKYVLELNEKIDFDIIWVDRVLEHAFAFFSLLRKKLPKQKIVGDTEAVYSRFVLRELPLISNPVRKFMVSRLGQRKVREEQQLVNDADVVTAVSQLDADYFAELNEARKNNIKLFSNIVDLADFEGDVDDPSGGKKYVLLIGSFGNPNSPMDRGAKWLVESIMPAVLEKVPDAHLYIVGRNSDLTLSHYNSDNITVVGRVRSMLPYLKNATASLVPLKYESGTRFKILETGASRIPCVSTTLGAEGLAVEHDKDILIADSANDFAEQIIRIFEDEQLAQTLADNLYDCISNSYSLKNQTNDAREIIDYLLEDEGSRA